MRVSRTAFVCIGIFSLWQFALPQSATAASYAAKLAGPTVLINNHGTLVQVTTTSSGTPASVTKISVVNNGAPKTVYTSPAGTTYSPSAINDSGLIVGVSSDATGKVHATIFSAGTITDIHSTIAAALRVDSASCRSFALDVNNSGEIVGYIYSGSSASGYKYKDGTVTPLSSLAGVPIASATHINNVGQITVTTADGRAGLYSQGSVQFFQYPATSGEAPPTINATALNDAGQVTGLMSFPNELRHLPPDVAAFVYEGGVVKNIGPTGGNHTATYAISTELPTINNAGVIVGTIVHAHSASSAFIYKNGQMQDLTRITDMSGIPYVITNAISINDDGLILALGNGVPLLLTPVPQTGAAIYNFEVGNQGWKSSGESIISVQTTSTQQPMSALQVGIWNPIGITVPSTAHAITSLGLEISKSGANTETKYVDEMSF